MGDVPYDRDPAPTKIPAAALEFDISAIGGGRERSACLWPTRSAGCVWKNGARLRPSSTPRSPSAGSSSRACPGACCRSSSARLCRRGARRRIGKELVDRPGPGPAGLSRTRARGRRDRDPSIIRRAGAASSYEVAVDWDTAPRAASTGVWSISSVYPESASRAALGHRKALADRPTGRWSARFVPRPRDRTRPGGRPSGPGRRCAFPTRCSRSSGISRRTNSARPRGAARRRSPSRPSGRPTTATCRRGRATSITTSTPSSATGPATAATISRRAWAFSTGSGQIRPRVRATTPGVFRRGRAQRPRRADARRRADGRLDPVFASAPTVSAWLAQHFYLHWRYSRDRAFLERAGLSVAPRRRRSSWSSSPSAGPDGKRTLPLSSSPEINDNRVEAWFAETTNYDLALIRWPYGAAAELAGELGPEGEAERWRPILGEWPELAVDRGHGRLLFAPGVRYPNPTGISRISWPSIRWA